MKNDDVCPKMLSFLYQSSFWIKKSCHLILFNNDLRARERENKKNKKSWPRWLLDDFLMTLFPRVSWFWIIKLFLYQFWCWCWKLTITRKKACISTLGRKFLDEFFGNLVCLVFKGVVQNRFLTKNHHTERKLTWFDE